MSRVLALCFFCACLSAFPVSAQSERAVVPFTRVLSPEAPAAAPVEAVAPAGRVPSVAELSRDFMIRYGKMIPHEWRERGPGIVSFLPQSAYCGLDQEGQTPPRGVALTLDACDGGTDMRIIALLREYRVPAAVFVTNRWLRGNAAIAADLAKDPLFTLEAHGARHKPASAAGWSAFGIPGTGNVAALVEEVESNARAVADLSGRRPRWFRSGTAFYDDVALVVIRELGLAVAGFSISADSGATLPAKTVARRLQSAKDGDILLCHVNHPESGTYAGLKEALPKMLAAGIQFVGL